MKRSTVLKVGCKSYSGWNNYHHIHHCIITSSQPTLFRSDYQEVTRARSCGALPDDTPHITADISHAASGPIKPSTLYSNHSTGFECSKSSFDFTPVTLVDDVNHLFDESNGFVKTCDAS